MIVIPDRKVQYKTESAFGIEISFFVPNDKNQYVDRQLIGFAYHKDSASPVTLTLYLKYSNLIKYKIREQVNFAGLDFYFQLDVPLPQDWYFEFVTSGAVGGGFEHYCTLFYA